MFGETRLDGRLELDDLGPQRGRNSAWEGSRREAGRAGAAQHRWPTLAPPRARRSDPGRRDSPRALFPRSIRRCSFSSLASTFMSHHTRATSAWSGASSLSIRSATAAGSPTRASLDAAAGRQPCHPAFENATIDRPVRRSTETEHDHGHTRSRRDRSRADRRVDDPRGGEARSAHPGLEGVVRSRAP